MPIAQIKRCHLTPSPNLGAKPDNSWEGKSTERLLVTEIIHYRNRGH